MKQAMPVFKELANNFVAYHYHTFGSWPDLNDIALEGLISKALKSHRKDVEWVQGAHLPYDIKLTESNLHIQVKGTLLQGNQKHIHLSSFRLGTHVDDLKKGILQQVNANDLWYVVARKATENAMTVWFFECDKSSFLYDENLYNFTKTNKRSSYQYECEKDGIFAWVRPSTSHQLWYRTEFDNFKNQQGVSLLATMEFKVADLPNTLTLK